MKASVIIVTFNHERYIERCLKTVFENDPFEVIVVDNGSKDKTVEKTREFPVHLIETRKNLGFSRANNLAAKKAKGKFLVFLNPDTWVEREWLKKLLNPLKDPWTVAIPTILLYSSNVVNTIGLRLHFTGLTFTEGYGKKLNELKELPVPGGLSGACFAIRKRDFLRVGGFDDRLFTYNEDGELSWRLKRRGFKIVHVPDSVVHHDYRLSVPPQKIENLERGRYVTLKKHMTSSELKKILPSLILTEVLTWGYSFLRGPKAIFAKVRGTLSGVALSVEFIRGKSPLPFLSPEIPEDQLLPVPLLKLVNSFYKWNYWRMRV